MLSGNDPGTVQVSRQPFVQNLVGQRALSGTGNAGDAGKDTQRNIHIDVFQVILGGSQDFQPAGGLFPFLRNRNLPFAGQILAGDGGRILHDLLGISHSHHFSAVLSGSRADIHDIVRRQHGILVMLHDNQGVSEIPQIFECSQKLVIVPLVKADAGFIQNIGHAHQAGTDLGCQADTLCLAAGQGPRCPGQGQIIQSHIDKETDSGFDLL